MFFSSHDQNAGSRSILPSAFEQALLQVNQSDGFSDAVAFAAEQAGCEFLFEVPGALFDHDGGRAAVIRSRTKPQDQESHSNYILYVIFDGEDGVIRILEEFEVPGSILAMTRSYSRVLEFIAGLPVAFIRRLH